MFRIPPAMSPDAYKTYRITAPKDSHWVPATCAEIECSNYTNGFKVVVDETKELGQRQAYYIRHDKTRQYTELKCANGLTEFVYAAGQTCFAVGTHKRRLQKPDVLLVQGGDYRGNPLGTPTVRHTKPEFWAEDFAEHQDRLAKLINGS